MGELLLMIYTADRFCLPQRQDHNERGTLARLALHPDVSAVILDDPVGDC
jgi:hypothetical protein